MPGWTSWNMDAHSTLTGCLARLYRIKRLGLTTKEKLPSLTVHTKPKTRNTLQNFGWETFDHPTYSPGFTPSVSHLFPTLDEHRSGHRFLAMKASAYSSHVPDMRRDKWPNYQAGYVAKLNLRHVLSISSIKILIWMHGYCKLPHHGSFRSSFVANSASARNLWSVRLLQFNFFLT